MHAIGHRSWAPLATIVVALGVHAVIVASLPKGHRSPLVLTTPVVEARPSVQGVVPPVAAPPAVAIAPAPQPAKAKAKAKTSALAPAAIRVARTKAAPPRDDSATKTETRAPAEDEAPVSFDTPLPVTIVMPPSDAR